MSEAINGEECFVFIGGIQSQSAVSRKACRSRRQDRRHLLFAWADFVDVNEFPSAARVEKCISDLIYPEQTHYETERASEYSHGYGCVNISAEQ